MGQDTESKSGFHNLLILPLVADKRLRDSSYILFHSVFFICLWMILTDFFLIPGIGKAVPNVSPFTCPDHPRTSHGRQSA